MLQQSAGKRRSLGDCWDRSGKGVSSGSPVPRHLISDAHEWINEIPTVPTYYLAKPQPRERAWT